jgi:hypothetical protein
MVPWGTVSLVQAQGPGLSAEEERFFEEKIRPSLVRYCYECHSAGEKIRGGLNLDSRDGWLHGGDSGTAIVPGKPDQSLLYVAASWGDPDLEMPPREKMPAAVIADFRRWIEMGAPDPRVAEAVTVTSAIDVAAGRGFWAFRPPVAAIPPAPARADWARTEIDRFVLAAQEARGLAPGEDAAPETLVRRLHFDLIGLPPSPGEVESFLAAWNRDPAAALAKRVDALLASPHFGERWGRNWLDVARYAESSGKEINLPYPHAWRYRDYVIDSFGRDKPFDRFLTEQIAGDLLPAKSDEEWQEHLIATGFLALGAKSVNEQNARQFAMDLADEQIDATFQAFQGLTVACARCHDHKSDPIPTTDYYALAGIFLSTSTHFGTVTSVQNRRGTELLLLPVPDEEPLKSYSPEEITGLRERLTRSREELAEAQAAEIRARRTGERTTNANLGNLIRLRTQIAQLESQLNGIDVEGRAKSFAMGVQERATPVDATVLIRGEVDKPAQTVPRGFLQVLDQAGAPVIPTGSSGRLELARWLASSENPLTARVFVNRVWSHLFGRGLVASPDNFGATGQLPSHPELLDHLAVRFMESGWSTKSLIREMVTSRVYRLSSAFDPAKHAADPDNVLLWRATPRRLDAEALRDAMLEAGGELDWRRPRASLVAQLGDAGVQQLRFNPDLLNQPSRYRSVYLPALRDALPEALALFDGADGSAVTGVRESTNVPGQALYLMNDPFVLERADGMARRLAAEAGTPRERFVQAFLVAYGRRPTEAEVASSTAFFERFVAAARERMGEEPARNLAFATFCQSLLASAEFRYLN